MHFFIVSFIQTLFVFVQLFSGAFVKFLNQNDLNFLFTVFVILRDLVVLRHFFLDLSDFLYISSPLGFGVLLRASLSDPSIYAMLLSVVLYSLIRLLVVLVSIFVL